MVYEKPVRPGAPANPPQHLPSDYGQNNRPSDADDTGNREPNEPSGRTETADPHPSTEEGYGRNSKIPATGL